MEIKACINCKYFKRFWLNKNLSDCKRPSLGYDYITGEINVSPCSVQRTNYYYLDTCGERGKYFESKKVIEILKEVDGYRP